MSYFSWRILIVLVLTCVIMAEAFWVSHRHSEKSLHDSLLASIVTGSGFVLCAGIDYFMIASGTGQLST